MLHLTKVAGKWMMVVSICAAIGLHWEVLQSVAWMGMLLDYSRTGTIASAVEKTFDGNHPCPLCKAIAKGEQDGKKQSYRWAGKIDKECRREVVLMYPPTLHFEWPVVASRSNRLGEEPSVPPPRAA